MQKNKKKGFTLVELLAVIAVLGLILIIAIPKVMETLNTQKKRTLELTAKSIIKAGEEKYLENSAYGIEEEITCESISNITSSDFESCNIEFDEEGNASVTIVGKGRYNGINVCNGTKENSTATNQKCINYKLGDTVYYNPVTNEMCENYIAENSNSNNVEGCLKWYVYNVNGNITKLILDHNILDNENSNIDIYIDSFSEKSNINGIVGLIAENVFYSTIKNWQPVVSIMSDTELLNLMPWYNNLKDKSNWITEYENVLDEIYNEIYEKYGDAEEEIFNNAMLELANEYGMLLPDYVMDNIKYNDGYLLNNLNDNISKFPYIEKNYNNIPYIDKYQSGSFFRPVIEIHNGEVKLISNVDNVIIEDILVPSEIEIGGGIKPPLIIKPSYANRNKLLFGVDNVNFTVDSFGFVKYIGDHTCGTSSNYTVNTTDGSNITKTFIVSYSVPC